MSSSNKSQDSVVHEYLYGQAKKIKSRNDNVIDKKLATNAARDLLVVSELEKVLGKVFSKGWVKPIKYSGKTRKTHNRIVNILLSDLHFGAHLDPNECPIEYNTVQESRRLGRVASQIADYKHQYRDESKLVIHLLGDVIQGQLHDLRDGEPLSIQFAAAVHYLTQFILFSCGQYPKVEVYCTPGNHGRNMARHPNWAVNQKFDSIETMIYTAVKSAVLASGVNNCTFVIPMSPYYTVQLFDSKMFATHGDTVLRPGNIGRSINIDNLARQVTKWNAARNIGGPFQIFAVGHIHVGSVTNLPDGITLVTNGCLIPPDAYSLAIGAPDNTCGQYLFETVEHHPVGDQRFIVVDGAEKHPKYNDIIKPFKGL